MANYTFSRTGAEIEAILNHADRKFKKLHTETADGTASFIQFLTDDDGNPFDVEELVMYATSPATDYAVRFTLYLQDASVEWKPTNASTTSQMQRSDRTQYTETRWYNRCDRWQCESVTSGSTTIGSYTYRSVGDTSSDAGSITRIRSARMAITGSVSLPAGTVFEFWGR